MMPRMRIYSFTEVAEAVSFALDGHQALHLAGEHEVPGGVKTLTAHLFDMDAERLEETARGLGVEKVQIEVAGSPKQHVDLWGRPLHHAIRRAENSGEKGESDAEYLLTDLTGE